MNVQDYLKKKLGNPEESDQALQNQAMVDELAQKQREAQTLSEETSQYGDILNLTKALAMNPNVQGPEEFLKRRQSEINKPVEDLQAKQKMQMGLSDQVREHLMKGLGAQQSDQQRAQDAAFKTKAQEQTEKQFAHTVNKDELNFNLEEAKLAQAKELAQGKLAQTDKEKQDKSKGALAEVENRKRTIETNVDKAIKMIQDAGTYNMVGSHNKVLNGVMGEIATDMAKLQDPNSVARPGEVEQVLKNLVQSGIFQKNSTAIDVLKDFKARVGDRAAEAYRVRGIEMPENMQFASTETKKTPIAKQYSESRNQTRIQYSDGSVEVKDGRQ